MSETARESETRTRPDGAPAVKSVVWDLDGTIWDGVLLEGDDLCLRRSAVAAIKTLDERGILHSIASRNDRRLALAALRRFGLADYFLHPQIGWGSKVDALRTIARKLNVAIESLAFVDDDPFERAQVNAALPAVRTVSAEGVTDLVTRSEVTASLPTDESKARRRMYQDEVQRCAAEQAFSGTRTDFLASLGIVLNIRPARESDLARAHELTVRTHQLNTTGRTYSSQQLRELCRSDTNRLYLAHLTDCFGAYGIIGLALIEVADKDWVLKLLLTSCRVMSRGVGTVLLNWLLAQAAAARATIHAEFVPTDVNRPMYATYKFAGFRETHTEDGLVMLTHDGHHIQPCPDYMTLATVERQPGEQA